MKSFTAKEFSRCPAKVYEAAREDGRAEVTHDRFNGPFIITHVKEGYLYRFPDEINEKPITLAGEICTKFTKYENKKASD